ncbi:IS607 family element RNA-guided endonuclease TnpB [Myceligenerans halotolerans]
MSRHATFRFCLDPSVEQRVVLARHVGAARFAFNKALELHLAARDRSARGGVSEDVPWSGFSLINAFNRWKRSAAAGRRFVVGLDGATSVVVTGLAWRSQVVAQVLEEAVVDVGRALKAWTHSRAGKRAGRRVGHPRFKKKAATAGSFRVRNKMSATGRASIQVGGAEPRSVTLPKIGTLPVHDDTRRLRRMIAKGRARILFATISRGAGGRWWISLTVQAADLHPAHRHTPRPQTDASGWVGVDRGLKAAVVAADADGIEVLRIEDAPRALRNGLPRLRRLARAVSRKKRGSANQAKARARLAREHERIRAQRAHFVHQVSNKLVKTHDRLVLEDLNITGMLKNKRLARAIGDAGWGELARQIGYKQAWRDGHVMVADRWFPSSKTCSTCQARKTTLTLTDRTFECEACGACLDRDLNAAINLAAWAKTHQSGDTARAGDRQTAGPVINARRQDHPAPHTRARRIVLAEAGTSTQTAPAV